MPFCFYTIIFKSHKNFGYCECIYIFFSYKNLQFSIYKFQSHFNFKTISIYIISKNNLHPFFFLRIFIFLLWSIITQYIYIDESMETFDNPTWYNLYPYRAPPPQKSQHVISNYVLNYAFWILSLNLGLHSPVPTGIAAHIRYYASKFY